MSPRRRERREYEVEDPIVSSRYGAEPPVLNNTMVGLIGGLFMGVLLGYVLGVQTTSRPPSASASAPVPVPFTTAAATAPGEEEIRAYRSILASDPQNVRANVELANRLYDAGRYSEAITYYQQAFTLNPKDVNVSTDLGTALWYAGRSDEALEQFAKSLAVAPTHPQTLFNMGIVRRDGKKDLPGATEAWERLLETNPTYPEAQKVREFIADARQQARGPHGARLRRGVEAGGLWPNRTGRS